MPIPDEHVAKILRAYLGPFATDLTETEKKTFHEMFQPTDESFLVYAPWKLLKKVGCFFLLRNNRHLRYSHLSTWDQIERSFDKESEESYYDVSSELFILSHLSTTPSNSYIPDLSGSSVSFRTVKGMQTLVLSEVELDYLHSMLVVKDLYDSPLMGNNEKREEVL